MIEHKQTPTEVGTRNEPTPVTDRITDVVVAPILTIVSTDSSFDVSVYNFFYFFLFMIFIFEISNHFFTIID